MKSTKYYVSISLGTVENEVYTPIKGYLLDEATGKVNGDFIKFTIDTFIQRTKDEQENEEE